MALIRELRPGDSLTIGDSVIFAEPKTGKVTRLRIDTTLPVHHAKAGQAPAAAPTAAPAAKAAAPTATKPTLFRSGKPD